MDCGKYDGSMQPTTKTQDEQAHLQAMPGYVRNHFEQRRAKDLQSRHEHPALYEQLDRIEAKLDHLLVQKRD